MTLHIRDCNKCNSIEPHNGDQCLTCVEPAWYQQQDITPRVGDQMSLIVIMDVKSTPDKWIEVSDLVVSKVTDKELAMNRKGNHGTPWYVSLTSAYEPLTKRFMISDHHLCEEANAPYVDLMAWRFSLKKLHDSFAKAEYELNQLKTSIDATTPKYSIQGGSMPNPVNINVDPSAVSACDIDKATIKALNSSGADFSASAAKLCWLLFAKYGAAEFEAKNATGVSLPWGGAISTFMHRRMTTPADLWYMMSNTVSAGNHDVAAAFDDLIIDGVEL